MPKVYGIIYLLTNTVSGKQYIGKTTNITKRMSIHKNNKEHTILSRAIKGYGWNVFQIECLDIIKEQFDRDNDNYLNFHNLLLNQLERYYIQKYNTLSPNGYNLTSGGEGMYNYHHTSETKRKLSILHLGKKKSEIAKQRMSISKKGQPGPNKGKKFTNEHIQNLINSHPGKEFADERGIVYTSTRDAAKKLKIHRSDIIKVLKGKKKRVGGHIFQYLIEANNA